MELKCVPQLGSLLETRDELFFPLSLLVTVPEVFAKVISVNFKVVNVGFKRKVTNSGDKLG